MNGTVLETDVLLARGGDHAAFTRIVERTANTVCAIALAIVRNVQASEDVAQETFVAAWSGLGRLRNPSSFLPWLRQIARHHAHLWRRRHEREILDDAALRDAVDGRPPADRALIEDEERRMLVTVLDELPDDAREVLVLFYREGSSTKQVAALLGISDEAVRQRLSRGRAMVRAELLQRFERAVTRTAPGVAFVAALATVLPGPAAAAMAAGSATGAATTATIAKAGAAGALLGWIGVLVGMKLIGPPIDAEEAAQLRRFRNRMLVLVTLGAVAVAISSAKLLVMLFTIQAMYAVIAFAYIVQLRRILARRPAGGRSLRATIGGAVTAAVTGSMLMAALIILLS